MKKGFKIVASILVPILVGIAIYQQTDEIYYALTAAVILTHIMTRYTLTVVNNFFELPKHMQGKTYEEIVKEVEEDGVAWDGYHYEHIKLSKEEQDKNA